MKYIVIEKYTYTFPDYRVSGFDNHEKALAYLRYMYRGIINKKMEEDPEGVDFLETFSMGEYAQVAFTDGENAEFELLEVEVCNPDFSEE